MSKGGRCEWKSWLGHGMLKRALGLVFLALLAAGVASFPDPSDAQDRIKILKRLGNSVFIGVLPDGRVARIRLNNRGKRRGRASRSSRRSAQMSRATRRQVQQRLNQQGFNAGAADGAFGRGTRAAIRRFQRSIGARATGRLTQSQLTQLLNGGGPAPAPAVVPASGDTQNFIMLPDTDLPGFDYRNPRNDRSLRGASEQACAAACNADATCQAFTYNRNASFCWLKAGHGARKRHVGAYSWIKRSGAPSSQSASASTTRSDGVAGIRQASARFGAACDLEEEVIRQAHAGTTVSLAQTQGRVGEELSLKWSAPNLFGPLPAYLMLSFDQPVRFSGDGFYALLPGDPAAFGLSWEKMKTRAIVPLLVKGTSAGAFSVKPIVEGKVAVRAAVVGFVRKCKKELVAGLPEMQFAAAPGRPEIAVDPAIEAAFGRLSKLSFRGRVLDVHKKWYRVLNAERTEEVFRRNGTDVKLSPDGRFVTADNGGGVEIVDTIDGKVLGKAQGFMYGWSDGGSFYASSDDSGLLSWGHIAAYNTLNDTRAISSLTTSSRADGPGGTTKVRVDIENNRVHISGSLVDDYMNPLHEADPRHAWKVEGTRPGLAKPLTSSRALTRVHLRKPVRARAIRIADTRKLQIASASGNASRSVAWRGLALTGNEGLRRGKLLTIWGDFGLSLAEDARRKDELSNLPSSDESGRALRSRLERRAPGMLKHFIMAETDYVSGQCVDGEKGEFYRASNFCSHSLFKLTDEHHMLLSKSVGGNAAVEHEHLTMYGPAGPHSIGDEIRHRSSSSSYSCAKSAIACDLIVRVADGKYVVAWGKESGSVFVYDLTGRKLMSSIPDTILADRVESFAVTENLRHIVQFNRDASIVLYDIGASKPVLYGRHVDGELIVWTNDGHYDATAEGGHFVKVKFPGEAGQYSFQQFEQKLRVRGLLEKVIRGEEIPDVDTGVPPVLTVSITSNDPERISGEASVRSAAGLKQLHIYQDGILSDRLAPGRNKDIAIDVPRLPGTRWVSVLAVDEDGLASLPMGRDLGSVARPTRIHTLAVGVNEYRAKEISRLSFAKADAELLARSISQGLSSRLQAGEQVVLTDKQVTREAILQAAETIVAEAQAGETVVFSFAGHGLRDKSGKFFLATHQTSLSDLTDTALAWEDLASVLSRAKARVIVFLDACHSGAAGTDFFATNDDAASGLLANVPSGLMVFAASKGREFALENAKAGNGFFTLAVADVISKNRKKHDRNGNGVIEISELYHGVKSEVVSRLRKSRQKQTPWLARNQMVGDFAVF